ncbi:glycosyltransferase family 4 protein [Sphingomonas sp. So64.6b]|uniref:glycosyltransferase family 4 protein n=1 Tax=Sphingomonas sp. So64.6b TaxID=2997354 RepID=UPI001602540E|nr:glycosyltransferase family 4 protein [Sphingomonas sp. So64.6b]QNA83495.1 glycosyltransferase family 4 protein [Sphingomonas sp. So64.6b]
MPAPVNILHLHSTFNLGGKEARAVRLMNVLGDRARHTIVSGMPDQLGARDAIARGINYEIAQNPPPLTGRPSVARFEAIARYMRRFDLVLTYNWGAIDGVMARRVFSKGLPPLVHHEDGFNSDEAKGLKRERNLYRRIALPAAYALVVPSETLHRIALDVWKQPQQRVNRIVNGIATAAYAGKPEPRAIPGLKRKPGEVIVGTLAGLREVKDLPALVRAVGGCSSRIRLVIVGEGPERATILEAADQMGLSGQLVMPGFLREPHRYIGLFDILALSSRSEQFPIAVIEGMAAGLPIAAPQVGDIHSMVSTENEPYIVDYTSEVRLRDSIEALARDAGLRATIGAANRAKAAAEYDESVMIWRYVGLYEAAMGRPGALAPIPD